MIDEDGHPRSGPQQPSDTSGTGSRRRPARDLLAGRLASASAWAPLRRPVFRALWMAQFGANVGTWAQTVGAQWLMGDLSDSAFAVALVQAAATVPVFLLVVPAGAFGDIFDRRRLLLTGQLMMFAGAGGLAALTIGELTTPLLLLLLIGLMGIGQAVSISTFQAIQPELVSRAEIPQAALLNGANANVARALGPALGGMLIAAIGPAATFVFNTLSFLGVLVVLYRWNRAPGRQPLGAERVRPAIRAGVRYVRSAPSFSTVLARSALFMTFAGGLWALLPAVARGPLALGPDGYGLLLGSVGLGAVGGALLVPRIRARVGANTVVTGGTFAYSAAMLVVGVATSTPAAVGALVLAGVSWIAVQSTLSASAQVLLPAWTRARVLAYFQLVFMGGQALGAIGWGLVAEVVSLRAAFVVPAAGLVVVTGFSVWALPLTEPQDDLSPVQHWPEPVPVLEPESDAGPVLVIAEWPVPAENAGEFVRAMRHVGRARRRTGATNWGLFRDVDDPALFVEVFLVRTWHEHLRQHLERGTAVDRELEKRALEMTVGGAWPHVRHLVLAPRE